MVAFALVPSYFIVYFVIHPSYITLIISAVCVFIFLCKVKFCSVWKE